MNLRYCLIAIAVMAVVTYIPRFVPITFFRREIKSVYLKNFLDYTPYAVLGALTFPDIFSASQTSSSLPSHRSKPSSNQRIYSYLRHFR